MNVELEGHLIEGRKQRQYADGLEPEQKRRIIAACNVVTERVILHETTRQAVMDILGLLLKEKKQALVMPKLTTITGTPMTTDQIALQDTHERGLLFGIQAAFDEITDGKRLSDLSKRLREQGE